MSLNTAKNTPNCQISSNDPILQGIANRYLQTNGTLSESEFPYVFQNIRSFVKCVYDATLGVLQDARDSGNIPPKQYGTLYTENQNKILTLLGKTFIENLNNISYFNHYTYYRTELPLFANNLALNAMVKLTHLTNIQEYLDTITDQCKTMSEKIVLFDFLTSILQYNEQLYKNKKLHAVISAHLDNLHTLNDSRFPVIYFNAQNDTLGSGYMQSSYPDICQEYFSERTTELCNNISGRVGNIFSHKTEDNTLHYGLDQHDPMIRIASDYAISLDMTNSIPMFAYRTEDSISGKKMLHAELCKNLNFDYNTKENIEILLQFLHKPIILMRIEKYLDIKFSHYPFSIQPPFLQFLAYATLEDFARVRDFLSGADKIDDKRYRLRLFLATAEKPNENKPNEIPIAEIILGLEGKLIETYSRENKENGEQAGKDRAQLIFKKYSEVMDKIDESAEEIQDSLIAHDANVTFSKQEFSRNLLGRANNTILRDFYKEVEHGSPERIDELFGKCRADLLQFGSLFRSITVHTPGDTLNTILSSYKVKREIVKGVDLVKENKEDVIKGLYRRNYRNRSDFDEVMRLVHDDFEQDSKDIDTEYSFFYYTTGENTEDSTPEEQGKPILAVKFTKKPDGTIYAGGLNSEPMLLQSSFGLYVFRGLLQQYNDKIVTGKVAKDSKKLLKTYGELGFESDEILHTGESGLECYDIIRPIQIM